MKIVFLSRYVNSVNRGVETYVLELSKLLRKNHQVDILSGKDSDSLKKIIKGKYDIVIATNGRLQALKASIGRFFRGYKLIVPGQAGVGKDDIWNIFVCCPDYYVALTDYEMDWAKKWAWRTKLTKIPNGVDLDKFKKRNKKIDINLSKPIVLSVGALTWYKYHERTIKAVAKLSGVFLLIVGDGPEKESLEGLGVKLLGERRFKIIKVGFNKVPEVYASADVFTLPSWIRESFGIVYVEAMASGLPVVAPDDPPRREIIGPAGIFTDVEDPEKFAQAIKMALSKDWGNIPEKQAEKFSWSEIAKKYERLFEELR